MPVVTTALVGAAVLLGAVTQRSTGLGFALVASPFLVLIAGPHDGVTLGNALSASLCAFVVLRTWRRIARRPALLLCLPALAVVPLVARLAADVPEAPMLVVVGSLAVRADLVVLLSRRGAVRGGALVAVGAGALGGAMNVAAGVGGPVAAAYGVAQRWPRETFVATMQCFLLVANASSLAVKGPPDVPGSTWLVAALALVAGAVVGERVAPRVPVDAGQRLVMAVALAGGLAAVVRGLLML
ncbi:TSUP family transporter [Kineococcus terrestris]|uniref:TSUP family transporter n=1 Tax=Kineococcus terrestris TaxID=2044856 RepID=UPI0034DABFC2